MTIFWSHHQILIIRLGHSISLMKLGVVLVDMGRLQWVSISFHSVEGSSILCLSFTRAQFEYEYFMEGDSGYQYQTGKATDYFSWGDQGTPTSINIKKIKIHPPVYLSIHTFTCQLTYSSFRTAIHQPTNIYWCFCIVTMLSIRGTERTSGTWSPDLRKFTVLGKVAL